MQGWKLVGLAGVAGVAAAGVVAARRRRAWAEADPDELREKLHSRLEAADRAEATAADSAGSEV